MVEQEHQPNTGQTNPNIVFTDAAALKVFELIAEEGNPHLKLRVFISGGGCSGFQYGFGFEEESHEEDWQVHKVVNQKNKDQGDLEAEEGEGDAGESGDTGTGTVTLLIDPMSFQYLQGAEIDYREDVNGAQFVIRNPNAKTTCGCGSSFAA